MENKVTCFHLAADDALEMATTSKLLFDKFLQDLQSCVNRELVDRAAQDFCMNHNTKRNRKKLARALFIVPRTRYNLFIQSFPFCCNILRGVRCCYWIGWRQTLLFDWLAGMTCCRSTVD